MSPSLRNSRPRLPDQDAAGQRPSGGCQGQSAPHEPDLFRLRPPLFGEMVNPARISPGLPGTIWRATHLEKLLPDLLRELKGLVSLVHIKKCPVVSDRTAVLPRPTDSLSDILSFRGNRNGVRPIGRSLSSPPHDCGNLYRRQPVAASPPTSCKGQPLLANKLCHTTL